MLNEVSIALRGREASTYRAQVKEYSIQLEGKEKSLDAVENLRIKSSVSGHKFCSKILVRLD